jgi:uncharacterized protein YndB with AHSA1/START domain
MRPEPYTASIHVDAPAERVYEHFTRPEAIVRWMGDYAALDPTPGGQFALDINGVPVRGRYLELEPPRRLVISWGHAGSERLPPGSSTVEITLTPRDGGTLVEIVHRGLPAPEAEAHARGWPHFLDRLAIAATGRRPGRDPWATAPPTTAVARGPSSKTRSS